MAYGGNYFNIMQKLDGLIEYHSLGGVDDPDLILECNALSVDIDKEILNIHKFIRHEYRLKSFVLESLVHHPIEYAQVVKSKNLVSLFADTVRIKLPYTVMMVFSSWRLGKAIEACHGVIALHSANNKLRHFVESRVGYVAPNLCAIVGNVVAVKLIGSAGGLSSLAKMLAYDIALLGTNPKRKRNLAQSYHGGYIEQCEIFQNTHVPPYRKMGPYGLVALKCTLAAQVDSIREYPTGELGKSYREEIRRKLGRWQYN